MKVVKSSRASLQVSNLSCGQCFRYLDGDTHYIKTNFTYDGIDCEQSLCVSLHTGIASKVPFDRVVMPIDAKVILPPESSGV